MTSEELSRYVRELDAIERGWVAEGRSMGSLEEAIVRSGASISVTSFDDLLETFFEKVEGDAWDKPELSDSWLAPRLHTAIRLTRSEAADRGTWHWLALRQTPYVDYRWGGPEGVARARWFGPVHKQALARLWWGAEMFRDGDDYTPVQTAFARQDIPNSYLHRTFVRCRPLALGLLDQLTTLSKAGPPKASQINDLARVVNLTTAGIPPEAETGFVRDDPAAYAAWLSGGADVHDWESLPVGPITGRRDTKVRDAGKEIAARAWSVAPGVAVSVGAKGAAAHVGPPENPAEVDRA